jgi:hypothetical protein
MSEWTPKNPRIREVPGNKPGRVKKIIEVYLVPGAAHAGEPNYRCTPPAEKQAKPKPKKPAEKQAEEK